MLLLDSSEIARMLDYPSCISAVERAFLQLSERTSPPPVVCGLHVAGGGFHVKAAVLEGVAPYFAAKTNANFPGNPGREGLPTIQGVVLLFDATNGRVLCAMDSAELTIRRTAAATALAARHLARAESKSLMLCGCGVQGRAHLRALAEVLPIATVYAYDTDPSAAKRLRDELAEPLSLDIRPVSAIGDHARASDVCVTCTPSRTPLLGRDDVGAGAFVAGVGADSPEKSELSPELLARGKVVVDVEDQCVEMGDLRHAIAAGSMARASVYAELGDIIAGKRAGRSDAREIIVFDSTGMALQDVAAAALVYERAVEQGRGFGFDLVAADPTASLYTPASPGAT